jgi:multiple sugar transport system permease protein
MFSKKQNRLQAKENISGYAFVAPALVCFILFMAFPFFLTLILSFFDFNFLKVKKLAHLAKYMKFCGFDNFVEMTKDRRFIQSIINTAVYTVATVPASIILGLALAYVMHGNIYCKKLLRLAFFIPYISSIVALGAVFKFLFREDGIVNNVLLSLNLTSEAIKWSVDPAVSKIPIILLSIWSSLGYILIIYMAAIENVPRSLYEAATIDGASTFTQFMKITVPLISPTTFYLIIVRMIAVFKIFSSVNVFTMGSSITSNTSIVQEIYSSAFSNYEHGYASAQSVVLLAIILIITAIQFWGQKKWVHY